MIFRNVKHLIRTYWMITLINRKGYPYSPSAEKDRCLTLVFAPNNNDTVETMRYFARHTHLSLDSDIIGVGTTRMDLSF